jgi:hypothetical protein
VPEKTPDFCCSQCGLNHEARDFIRAILLHLIDRFSPTDTGLQIISSAPAVAPPPSPPTNNRQVEPFNPTQTSINLVAIN